MLFNPISVLMYLFVFLSRLVFMRFGVHDSRTITVFLVITVFLSYRCVKASSLHQISLFLEEVTPCNYLLTVSLQLFTFRVVIASNLLD